MEKEKGGERGETEISGAYDVVLGAFVMKDGFFFLLLIFVRDYIIQCK